METYDISEVLREPSFESSLDSPVFRLSVGESNIPQRNFLRFAYEQNDAREVLGRLINAGYYPYRQEGADAIFTADWNIGALWHRIRNGELNVSPEGLIYKLERPSLENLATSRLVVVFSSMSSDIFGAGLARYFEQNYRSIQKFLPAGSAILRIADIGGVVGAFYLNTQRDPDNIGRIQRLISDIAEKQKVGASNVTLYGASKGGTGALLHGLVGGYDFVSVDPVVNDVYYETKYNDSHFTGSGIFKATKEAVFSGVLQHSVSDRKRPGAVITSPSSPQYPYISDLWEEGLKEHSALIASKHPDIRDHPDVSAKTLNYVPSLITAYGLGMSLPASRLSVLA